MAPRKRRAFSDEFKQHIVDLYQTGLSRKELIEKYDLTPSAFDRWVRQARETGSFREIDNLTDTERELIDLRKKYQEIKIENEILKQAALILAKKEDT